MPKTGRYQYREEYLQALVASLRSDFAALGVELPIVRCSCSFAYRGGRRVVGQCFPGSMAVDGIPQIKISPVLDNAVEVAAVLVHELIHACRPGARHGKPFREIAVAIGLTGPMRSTAAGPALRARLLSLTDALGTYPHAALHLDSGRRVRVARPPAGDTPDIADNPRPQTGRLIKVSCPTCEYPARVTRVWLSRLGPPICPCGRRMEVDVSHPLFENTEAT